MINRARGPWESQGIGPTVAIAPPASDLAIEILEKKLGRPIPETLREVLSQVSDKIELQWFFPASQKKTSWGYDVIPRVTPPDQFLQWSHGLMPDGTPPEHAKLKPKFISGGFSFGIETILSASEGYPWSGSFDYMRDITNDPETLAHYDLIEEFMSFGLPVMTAPNGDWLAIDLRDGNERLLHVSHEGEEAGIELDLTLPQFLTHLSWLGPVFPDFPEILDFSTSVTEVVPGDHRVTEARFDAEGEYGTAWREWFWQDVPPPRPHESLLERVETG